MSTEMSTKRSIVMPQPLFESGYPVAICAPIASICARACSTVTPGFSVARDLQPVIVAGLVGGPEGQRPPHVG